MRILLNSVSIVALLTPVIANGTETITYSYDAQGRLVQSVISGTVNNGQSSSTSFDAAGNRVNYAVSLSGGVPPPPPPPPPPANRPPVTVGESLRVQKCSVADIDVLVNDSDPEGNTPLTLVGVTNSNPAIGSPGILTTTRVVYDADVSGATGVDIVTYSVSDSLGAVSTGTLTVTVTRTGSCIATAVPPPDAGGG